MNHEIEPTAVRPEVLIASTLYLMSQCALNQICPGRAAMVLQHLSLIAKRDDLDPMLRSTAVQLTQLWSAAREALMTQTTQQILAATSAANDRLH
jgi:hypothetical protein